MASTNKGTNYTPTAGHRMRKGRNPHTILIDVDRVEGIQPGGAGYSRKGQAGGGTSAGGTTAGGGAFSRLYVYAHVKGLMYPTWDKVSGAGVRSSAK